MKNWSNQWMASLRKLLMRSTFACLASTFALPALGVPVCSVTASGVAFGSYNPLPGQAADTVGTITVTCSGLVGDTANYTIKIAAGNGNFTSRQLTSGASTLDYNLYSDASRTLVWGDGTGSTVTKTDQYTLSSTVEERNYVVYGRIFGPQYSVTAQAYTDDLLITVTY